MKGVSSDATFNENFISQFNVLTGLRERWHVPHTKTMLDDTHGCVKTWKDMIVVRSTWCRLHHAPMDIELRGTNFLPSVLPRGFGYLEGEVKGSDSAVFTASPVRFYGQPVTNPSAKYIQSISTANCITLV